MTPKEFKKEIEKLIEKNTDEIGLNIEEFHMDYDRFLEELLEELGYSEGIKLVEEHKPFWHA
jgi:hypothetical protein